MGYINLPRDSEGWSIFTPSSDSQIVYVSEAGNDSTGVVYAHDYFADPFDPTGEMAFATYAGAYAATRDDSPDWILWKRGDEFVDSIPLYDIHDGRSETEPFLVGSYGASGDYPVMKIGANVGIDMRRGASFLVYNTIDFYSHTADPDSPDFVDYTNGQSFQGTLSSDTSVIDGLMFEACKFRFNAGCLFQKHVGVGAGGITMRRNLIYKAFSDTAHAAGLYTAGVDGLIIEENIFYHNGWLVQNYTGDQGETADGQANSFNHNMYLTLLSNASITNNLIIEGAGAGLKMTSSSEAGSVNVTVEDNLFLGGIIGMNVGNNYDAYRRFQNLHVTSNVFTNIGWSRPTNEHLAWYTYNDGWEDSSFTDNLLLYQDNLVNDNVKGLYFEAAFEDVDISNNTVYGLGGEHSVGLDIEVDDSGNPTLVSNLTITDNIVQMPTGTEYITNWEYDSDVTYADNKYFNAEGLNVFKYLGTEVDFATWQTSTGDTSIIKQVAFFDNARDIASYNVSVGGTASIQAFIDECILQDRYNWNTDYEASAVNDYLRAGFTEVFMTTTYHTPNTWNNSNNSYKYPEVQALIDADALQNLAGDGSVMFDGSGNALAKSQAEIFVTDGVLGNNKQLNGCPAFGITQYENKLTSAQQAEVELDNYSTCNPDLELLFDEESGETLYDEVTGHLLYDEDA